jgi:hypothetical protein
MPDTSRTNVQGISERIAENLHRVTQQGVGLRKLNTALIITTLVSSGLTTVLTGVTAARGPVIASGVAGWQLACAIAAVLSFVGALCTGIAQQMRVGERLAKTLECLGRLKALDASVLAGSRADSEIAAEYENILRSYGEVLR